MTRYVITRTADCDEWGMTELDEEVAPIDIYRSADGSSMRAVMIFEAPSWEDAKRIFDWAFQNLRAAFKKLRQDQKGLQSWDDVQSLLDPLQTRAMSN